VVINYNSMFGKKCNKCYFLNYVLLENILKQFFLFLNFILDISALKQLKKTTKLIFKKKTLNFFKIRFNCTPVVVVVFHCHVRTYLS